MYYTKRRKTYTYKGRSGMDWSEYKTFWRSSHRNSPRKLTVSSNRLYGWKGYFAGKSQYRLYGWKGYFVGKSQSSTTFRTRAGGWKSALKYGWSGTSKYFDIGFKKGWHKGWKNSWW